MTDKPAWMQHQLDHCTKPESNRLHYRRPKLSGIDKAAIEDQRQEKVELDYLETLYAYSGAFPGSETL